MIIVSSCGVKLQEDLSRLGKRKAKTLEIHVHFCGFSQHSFLSFFLSTWGVTIIIYAFKQRIHEIAMYANTSMYPGPQVS